jgi:hypothetical protein
MLLLLLWRHLVYYVEGRHINNPDLKASTSRFMRLLSTPGTESLKVEVAQILGPILQQLVSLNLVCMASLTLLMRIFTLALPRCTSWREMSGGQVKDGSRLCVEGCEIRLASMICPIPRLKDNKIHCNAVFVLFSRKYGCSDNSLIRGWRREVASMVVLHG